MANLKLSSPKYTLVQHSAGVAGHSMFQQAVELRSITEKQAKAVLKAGGVVFETYNEALDAEEANNYPPDLAGLVPKAPGTFSEFKVYGSPVYLPAKPVIAGKAA
jgi:hypothetical protein